MKLIKKKIPNHLKNYIVTQNYKNYSYIDHACWRYIMKISEKFFAKHADPIYLRGLKQTGITLDKIPNINSINKKLNKFGWKAVCVRGFIPPQIFMEFQSKQILPIAADMRTHKHLTYTPAPDIVHEAAGHAPIIANKEYSDYLKAYGEVATKAIMSSEDMNLYYAIRDLSNIKEDLSATKYKIKKYENNLKNAYNNISYTSESAMLSRMNWWTVEYGLIGNINKPKIYGAGLLSSVGESENCLSNKIKKIPFNLDCINYSYDITEQQPQLFVTRNYKHLTKILKKLSKKMSYKIGGKLGLKSAIKAKTPCSVEIDCSIQVSGIVDSYILHRDKPIFIKLNKGVQISYKNKQLKGHGIDYHSDGFSTPLGKLKKSKKTINQLSDRLLKENNIIKNHTSKIEFQSGVIVVGKIEKIVRKHSKIILITFNNCTVKYKNKILFDPKWGKFDMICGEKINSVFFDYADKNEFYKKCKSTELKNYNKDIKPKINNLLNELYRKMNKIRNNKVSSITLKNIYNNVYQNFNNEWLLKFEILELAKKNKFNKSWVQKINDDLLILSSKKNDIGRAIKRGLELIK